MKKLLFAAFIGLIGSTINTSAQIAFRVNDSLDINNINAGLSAYGNMWSTDPANSYIQAHCFFPANTHNSINFAGNLWLSGYDAGGQLHIAAQTYRQDGNDFWPGPLTDGTLTYAESYKWGKIWKVNRTDIQSFRAMTSHTEGNTLPVILTWPGKGNTHAIGNDGYALTVDKDMAPFADLNGNGIYEPLNGEYPAIKGDQAAWWVFSDNGPSHGETNGKALGVEVHAMAYGYKRNSLIDNVLYYEYDLINRSPNNYQNFRAAIWDDVEIGYYMDDYIGYDASHRMGVAYNATDDDGYVAGHPVNSYGTAIPATGLSLVELPGDTETFRVSAGCFNYYNNDASIVGNPAAPEQYDNYMRSKKRDGSHITSTYNGPGMPCNTAGTGPACDYVYPGDPSDPNQWSECECGDMPGDRRFILSSSDFTLPAGATKKFSVALMAIADEGGCGTVNFMDIKKLADTVWNVYHNPLPSSSVNDLPPTGINIYPNPAHDKLFIGSATGLNPQSAVTIYDVTGRRMNVTMEKGKNYSIDISNYPAGIYHVQLTDGDKYHTATFIKN